MSFDLVSKGLEETKVETLESKLRDGDTHDFEMESKFSFEWGFKTADQAIVCADMTRALDLSKFPGIQASVYYVPNKPRVDAGEENFRAALKALLAENCTREVFVEDVEQPREFVVTLDLHLDGADNATHLSATVVDYSREVLKKRHSMSRNVCCLLAFIEDESLSLLGCFV